MDNSSAEAYGRSVGSFVGFIIVALVCLAIWRNSRRPTVNRKCAWSLYFPLAAFGTAAIVGGLFPGNRLALLVTVPFMLLTIFVSPIFAVQGLLELRKQPDRTGHGYAWWGFGLALLIAALFGAGIVKGVRKNRGLHAVRQTPLTSGRVVNTNLNFSVIPPPKPFLELDPKVLKSDASVFFRRVNPEVNSYVIAEALDVDLDSKELVEIAKVNLSAILSETSFTEPKPLTLSGIPGFLFESDGRLGFRSVKGYHWCGVENGFVYQIVTQGVADPALEKNATEFRSSFQRLDPTKRAQTGGLPIVPFKSPAFDYSIDLSQDGWQFWPSLAKDFDMAEFGAHRRQRAYLTVSPFYLYERDVPIETLADVAAGLAEVRLSSLPPEAIQRGENFVAFEFDRRVGSDAFSYRIKVIRARGSAYLLHGWWPLEEKAFRNDVLAAFESLSISPGGDLMEGKPPAEKARALRGIQLNSGQGGCYNTLGLLAFNTQDWKNAADWFALAVQYQPKERVVFENLLSALKRTGDAPAALTAIEKHEAANGSADWLRAEKAWFIAHSGNVADARAAYEKVFAGSYTDDEQFDEYVTLLLESGEAKAALAAVESYLKRRDNTAVRLLQSVVLQRNDKAFEAVAVLTNLVQKFPTQPNLSVSLINAQLNAEMFDQAIAASDDLARRGHSTGYLALLKGRAHFGLKRYREARASFEVAVRLDPQNPDARLFLDQVNGILGQGNNYSITAEIQPVPLPESLVDSQLPTEIPAGFKDSGAYYLRHSTAIHYRKGHPAKITTRFIVKILDQSGVNSFSAVQWGFNPLSETVYLNDITVRDERGEILAKVSRDQCYVIDARNATFERAFNAPVPGLRPGVAISATFTKQSLGKLDHPRFWEYLMCQWSPTLDSIVAVTGDVDDVEVIGPQSLSRQDFPGGIAFRFSNAPAIRYERFQPVLEYFVPTIAIGPKDRPWADEVRDYLKEIDPRLAIDETTKQFARDAIKGAKTDLEKTRALSRAVQNKVRYVALEFGRRGIIPNTPRETIANAYGDCKDASVLLKACLDSSGIPALLALAAPGRQHYPELTSLDQFTHMLVYVPSLKMFLDPTDKNVDLTLQPPGALLDSDALILDADPKFLPVHNPSAKFVNRLEIQRDVSFNEQNDVLIKDTTRFIGFAASGFRGLFSQIAAPEHLPEARDIFGRRLPNLVLTDVKIQNLDDVAQPLIIATSLASAKPAARDGKFPLPVVWEDFVLGADSNTDRRTPFTFKPADVQIVTTIKTPKAPREKVEPVTSKFGEARLAFAHTNGVLTATATVNLEGGRHPAADYPEYNRFITAAESLLTTAIDLAAPPKATAANR